MKFKNSYILLIAIAIFLLISIGSVCASENVTDDSADTLADDGTNVVLSNDSDTDGNVPDDTNEKINTTVETGQDSYEFKQDSNKTIPVEVKDNESSKIAVNKNDLSISNGNKNISFEYNSTISMITITEQLPCGYHNLTINYLGNGTYVNSYKNITVKIYGNKTIETETSVVSDGKNVEIPVKVYDQVEYIKLIENNFNLTLVCTSETGNIRNVTITSYTIENGTIKFTTDESLIDASVIVDYTDATEPKTVAVKVSTEVKAETDKDKFKSEEIKNISITIKDGQGNLLNVNKNDLKVFDNGNEITNFNYNNSNITLDLSVGVHNITVTYKGNETYNASTSNSVIMKVSGNYTIIAPDYVIVIDGDTVIIPVTLFDGVDNVTAEANNFILNYTYKNETGNVNSRFIDAFNLENGEVKFLIQKYESNSASVIINYTNSIGPKTVKINLPSVVEATAEGKYRFNETNDITVKVSDASGNKFNITKNDLKVLDNGKDIAFTFNATSSVINVNLAEGVHNLTIVYKGNDTYNSSSTTIEQKVFGDLKFNPDKTVVLDESNKVTITLNLNDGADLVDINQTKLNVTVFYTINNQTLNKTVETTVNGQNITFDLTEDFKTAYANIKYGNLAANTTIKVNTEINGVSDSQFGASEIKNFTVEVKGTNGHNINITKDNIKVLKDGKALNITVNNSVITINDKLNFGIYNLTFKYIGEDAYLESVKNVVLTVYGINATSTANVNSTKEGNVKLNIISGNETVNITADKLKLNVTYKDGNNTIEVPVSSYRLDNGTLYFILENGNFTKATLTIRYNNTETNVTLNRVYNVNIIPVTVTADYQEGNFTFKLIDIDTNEVVANKTVSVTMTKGGTNIYFITKTSAGGYNLGTSTTLTTDENGIATLVNQNFYPGLVISDNIFAPVGNYSVKITGSGVVKGENTTNITINKIDVNIALEKYEEYYGSDKKVKIIVTNAKTGKTVSGVYILLNITGATLSSPNQITDANGTIQLGVTGLYPNTFKMKFTTNDTNLNNGSGSGSFTIKKIPVVINGKDVTVYYNSGTTYTIKVTKDKKALSGMYILVRLYSTSSKYNDYLFQTNSKGQVAFSASLAVGKHKIIVTSADTRYDAKQITKTITVKKASAKITAKKVTDYYKGTKYFTVKLTNSKTKKAIYDAKINIKVYVSKNRYYNYNGNTGMNGQIKLSLDSLKPGSYKVEVSGADSKNFEAKKVTSKIVIKKAPIKFIAKKVTAKKGKSKYFKVTVKNKKTKKVVAKVKIKVKVYTGKKAKTYTLKTNAKGIAKLNVNKLKVGKHKVIITSADKYCTAKKTKSSIKIKK